MRATLHGTKAALDSLTERIPRRTQSSLMGRPPGLFGGVDLIVDDTVPPDTVEFRRGGEVVKTVVFKGDEVFVFVPSGYGVTAPALEVN